MSDIKITRTTSSRRGDVDFDNIPFGKVFADHMFVASYDGEKWTDMEIKPFGTLTLHPAMLAIHYGQSIFEGMKAGISKDGNPILFRPEMHSRRLNNSARRLCMPEFPEEKFIEALEELLRLDHHWIPTKKGSSLYIRPFMFATDEFIGVRPSDTYKLIIFTQPVGPYYSEPVKLLAEKKYIRAAMGGTGEAKAAGNYAGSLLPAKLAKEQGYDQVLWLDAREYKYIQEVGTMNIFFVIDGVIVTPATSGTILKGITRDTFIHVLTGEGYKVEEREVSIDEIEDAHRAGTLTEVFGAGTAAVVAKVSKIKHLDNVMEIDTEAFEIAPLLFDRIDALRNGTAEDPHGWRHPVLVGATV